MVVVVVVVMVLLPPHHPSRPSRGPVYYVQATWGSVPLSQCSPLTLDEMVSGLGNFISVLRHVHRRDGQVVWRPPRV